MTGPLSDLEVVELTQMVAGGFVGMQLSDYGAQVIKVERPGDGEIARNVEPSVGGESFYYASVNRGKRSVTIDLGTDAGRAAFFDVVDDADVLVENYTPGTVERLGVDYESVSERNPEIVYCSVSAYGQTGPKSQRSGIDTMLQAYAGVAAMTRDTDGRPMRCGLPVADLAGAMYASQAILVALYRREQTGEGEYLDVALGDSLLSFLSVRAGYSFATGEPFPSIARQHVYFVPEGIFETADGYVQVSAVTQDHWERLCRALDRPDLRADPSFADVDARRDNRDELVRTLEDEFERRSTRHWERTLEEYGVPVEVINDTRSVWDDEQTVAREMRTSVTTPDGEPFGAVAPPVKHRRDGPEASEYVAELGADTADVLGEAGYTDEEIAALADADVI